MKNKLVKVTHMGSAGNEYIFIADSSIEEQDIVITGKTYKGFTSLGIVTCADVDPIELNNAYLPLKKAYFLCKSTHDLGSSRNTALKSVFAAHDVYPINLINEYLKVTNSNKDDLPF